MDVALKDLAKEHPITMSAMDNMPLMHRHNGDLQSSEQLEVQIVDIRTAVFGLEHRLSLNSLATLT